MTKVGSVSLHFNGLDESVSLSVIFGAGVINLSPVKVTAVKCLNEDFGGGDISSNGNIVKIAHSHHFGFFLIKAKGRASVSKVDKKVNLIISETGSDLLFAAVLTCEELFYLKTCRVGDILCSNARCAKVVLTENAAICDTELCHKFFFHVVSYNCNFHLLSPFYIY